jgi:hypothetical protein
MSSASMPTIGDAQGYGFVVVRRRAVEFRTEE